MKQTKGEKIAIFFSSLYSSIQEQELQSTLLVQFLSVCRVPYESYRKHLLIGYSISLISEQLQSTLLESVKNQFAEYSSSLISEWVQSTLYVYVFINSQSGSYYTVRVTLQSQFQSTLQPKNQMDVEWLNCALQLLFRKIFNI